MSDWRRNTTTAYRMGFVEGMDGGDDGQDMYLLKSGVHAGNGGFEEYMRGFEDGKAKRGEFCEP